MSECSSLTHLPPQWQNVLHAICTSGASSSVLYWTLWVRLSSNHAHVFACWNLHARIGPIGQAYLDTQGPHCKKGVSHCLATFFSSLIGGFAHWLWAAAQGASWVPNPVLALSPARTRKSAAEEVLPLVRQQKRWDHFYSSHIDLVFDESEALSKKHLASWLCERISRAYRWAGLDPPWVVWADSTHGVPTALFSGGSVEDVCMAASWKMSCLSIRFYLFDMSDQAEIVSTSSWWWLTWKVGGLWQLSLVSQGLCGGLILVAAERSFIGLHPLYT